MIRFATAEDRKDIIDLWQSAFGDSISFIESFLNFCSLENALVYIEDNSVVAFTFLPEITIYENVSSYRANYIYALCTKEEYRNRGFAKELIDFSKSYSAGKGIPYTLVRPANQPLFEFYSKFGFDREYYRIKKNLTIDERIVYNKQDIRKNYPFAVAVWNLDPSAYSDSMGLTNAYIDISGIPVPAVIFNNKEGGGICILPDAETYIERSIREKYLMLRKNTEAKDFKKLFLGLTFE